MTIRWNEPRFGEEELKEVEKVINNSFLNEGPKSRELEDLISNYLGVKHVILTVNGTAALFLALKADAMIRDVDDFEVLIPDMTMFATATSVNWAGGKPVTIDVSENRMTIDTEKIEEKITSRTTAIMPVHVLGRAADMEKITEIAEKHNLTIIEDAAGALGSKYNNQFLGTIGKVGCFSLQSNKIVTTGQGGIIVTNDDEYYEKMKRLRDFGRLNKEFYHEEIGYNLKFNDLLAAIGIIQFKKIEQRKEMLLKQYEIYKKQLADTSKIKFPNIYTKDGEIPLWIDVFAEDAENLINFLKEKDIHCRQCWPAIHKNTPYKNQGTDLDFPNSSYLSDNVIWLPNGPAVNNEQIIFICKKIKEFYKELEKIHEDKRGGIYLVKNLLEDEKEFTFMEIKTGYARGGCLHSNDEYFVVIKGKVKYICGEDEKELTAGDSGVIPAFKPHAFVGIEDSIVSEWGITSEEKMQDSKDEKLRSRVDQLNQK